MAYRILKVTIIGAMLALGGCAATDTVFVHNESKRQIAVTFDSGAERIPPGNTVAIKGLPKSESIKIWYLGGTATYSSGLSIIRPKSAFFSNRYYCERIFGARINMTFTEERELLLEPCSNKGARMPIKAEYGIRLAPKECG